MRCVLLFVCAVLIGACDLVTEADWANCEVDGGIVRCEGPDDYRWVCEPADGDGYSCQDTEGNKWSTECPTCSPPSKEEPLE